MDFNVILIIFSNYSYAGFIKYYFLVELERNCNHLILENWQSYPEFTVLSDNSSSG